MRDIFLDQGVAGMMQLLAMIMAIFCFGFGTGYGVRISFAPKAH